MDFKKETNFKLSPGTQMRQEDFGLLFYTMGGPQLYFLSSGKLLNSSFFKGNFTLNQWLQMNTELGIVPSARVLELKGTLDQLREKGVLLEC